MAGSQGIEQLALHLRTGETGSLLFQLAAEQFLELVEAVDAELLGEFVVDLRFGLDLHLLHLDIELGFLALQVFSRVIFGEGYGDGLLVTGLHTHQLLFEAGDELARTDHQRSVFGLAAFEFLVAETTGEVDDQLVAVGSLLGLRSVLVSLVLASDALDRIVDCLVRNRHGQAFQLQAVDRRSFDGRKHFELDSDLGILAFFIAFAEVDLGLHRRTQFLVAHQAVDRIADHVVERLRVQLFAMHLLDEIRRHLARTEARHFHLRSELLDLGLDLLGDFLRLDGDLIGALEAFVGGFLDLHGIKTDAFSTNSS